MKAGVCRCWVVSPEREPEVLKVPTVLGGGIDLDNNNNCLKRSENGNCSSFCCVTSNWGSQQLAATVQLAQDSEGLPGFFEFIVLSAAVSCLSGSLVAGGASLASLRAAVGPGSCRSGQTFPTVKQAGAQHLCAWVCLLVRSVFVSWSCPESEWLAAGLVLARYGW